jgi:hypothetical protein
MQSIRNLFIYSKFGFFDSMPVTKKVEDAKSDKDFIEIETANATYKLKRPKGLLGAKHFRIMMRSAPTKESYNEDGSPSPRYMDQLNDCRLEWEEQVLPLLLVDTSIDDVYGEDFFALFTAMSQEMKILPEVFRIL